MYRPIVLNLIAKELIREKHINAEIARLARYINGQQTSILKRVSMLFAGWLIS